jgi:Mn2+/Fe2+ NRAMP family transporter
MEIVMEQFANFLNTLDWVYIFSFILITQAIMYYRVPQFIGRGTGIKIRNRYQVLIIGLIYGIIVFFVRGYDLPKVLSLFISFLLATTFHKFLLESVFEKIFPKKVIETPKDDLL